MKTFSHKDTISLREIRGLYNVGKLTKDYLGYVVEDTVSAFYKAGCQNQYPKHRYCYADSSLIQAQIVCLGAKVGPRVGPCSIILVEFPEGEYKGHTGGEVGSVYLPHGKYHTCWWIHVCGIRV